MKCLFNIEKVNMKSKYGKIQIGILKNFEENEEHT